MKLKQEYIEAIDNSNRLKALLAAEFNKTTMTIENWCKTKSIMLTTPQAVKVIATELNVDADQLLTEEKIHA